MAEENDADENDVEAEMLRMMQEELGGDDADSEEGDAADSDDSGGDDSDVDSLLEEEMLKAMQEEGGGDDGGADPMSALAAFAGQESDYGEETEGIGKLSDVEVEVTVELGDNLIPIQNIMSWTSGSVVELQPEEHEPVKVLLNGSPFAKGEIVVVGDTFGVRIVELLDPSDPSHH